MPIGQIRVDFAGTREEMREFIDKLECPPFILRAGRYQHGLEYPHLGLELDSRLDIPGGQDYLNSLGWDYGSQWLHFPASQQKLHGAREANWRDA